MGREREREGEKQRGLGREEGMIILCNSKLSLPCPSFSLLTASHAISITRLSPVFMPYRRREKNKIKYEILIQWIRWVVKRKV
jgi:hypothetical protein